MRVYVTAPPADGEANEAVQRLVAKVLGIAKSKVEIAKGAKGRDKVLRIEGLSLDKVQDRLRNPRSR